MKDAAFQDLLTSVRQAGQIRRGTRRPSRTTTFRPTDVQAVRAKLGASQAEFALMIGVSVSPAAMGLSRRPSAVSRVFTKNAP